jgi:hypothetical protein
MKSRAPKDAENFATWEWDVDVKTQETKERNAWIRLRKLRGDVFELPTKVAIMSTNIVGSFLICSFRYQVFKDVLTADVAMEPVAVQV